MKKTKLALSKQTIARLTGNNLSLVAGGGHIATIDAACAGSDTCYCTVTQNNCGGGGGGTHACIATRNNC